MCELSPLQFHGDTIYCIEFGGQPFTAMKPIVENMGLNWASQTVKLNTNKERWGVAIIAIPSDGGEQETLCMPVRKLPAYLASINPNKVAPELRERIELYQNESDDALWNYWINGKAERQQTPVLTNPTTCLTPSDQNIIQALVKAIADRYPADEQKGIYAQIWMRFRNHFRIGSYKQLPQSLMADAVAYLANLKVNEKKGQSQKELPPAYTPLAEKGRGALNKILALRRELSATSMEIMDVMQDATHHKNIRALNDTQKEFSGELNASVCTFFMCINHNMIAIEHMFKAFCEAEKLIYS